MKIRSAEESTKLYQNSLDKNIKKEAKKINKKLNYHLKTLPKSGWAGLVMRHTDFGMSKNSFEEICRLRIRHLLDLGYDVILLDGVFRVNWK